MELLRVLKALLSEPLMVCLLLICAVFAAITVLQYFRAIRPRRGTTEWMQKVDSRSFAPLRLHRLAAADAVWALLVALCAACLRFCYLFFHLQLHRRPAALQILLAAGTFFLQRIVLCVVFALSIYFLIRLLFGRPLPAICGAIVGALIQNHNNDTAALLALSLLLFLLWMGCSYDGSVFRGIWLVLSLSAYALCLLSCWECAWLSPLYAAGYFVTLILRFRKSDPKRRIGKLILSLMTMLLLLPAGGLVLWMLYAHLSGRAEGGILTAMRTFAFYEQMIPVLKTKVYHLLTRREAFLSYMVVYESFLLLLGGAACIPLLHNLFREKDSSAVLLLVLLLGFLLLWVVSGVYLMNIPMLLILGKLWSRFCQRELRGFAALSACLLMAFDLACMILH